MNKWGKEDPNNPKSSHDQEMIGQKLEEERHMFRLLIENVPENIYFKDAESRFVLANSATAKKLGAKDASDLVGRRDEDYFDADHTERSREEELEVMRTGRPVTSNIARETWDNREDSWVMTTKLPWYDPDGQLKGTFGISSDVTELIKTQKKLEQTAAALERRNRSYEEEIQLAREIQNAFIPRSFAGFTAHGRKLGTWHRYLPSSALGGDYLDVFRVDENRCVILICDVMGHGIRSALVTYILRGLIEDHSRELRDLAAFAAKVNESFQRILHRAGITLFATMTAAVLHLELEELTYITAGHHAPLLISPDGQIIELPTSKNLALGLMSEAHFVAQNCRFPVGSRLFLWTDGLIEASNNEGEAFGKARLLENLSELVSDGMCNETMSDRLLSQVTSFCEGRELDDDLTYLITGLETAKNQ